MITDKHLKILKKLRNNSRESLSIVSRNTNIRVPEVYSLIDNMYDSGMIKKFTSILDHSAMGYGFNMMFNVKVNSSNKFKEDINKYNNINNAFMLSNSSCTLQCFFKEMQDVETFKESLELNDSVESFSEHHILDTIKHESFLN